MSISKPEHDRKAQTINSESFPTARPGQQRPVENPKGLVPSLLVTQSDEPNIGTPVSLLKAFWGYSGQMLEGSSGPPQAPPASQGLSGTSSPVGPDRDGRQGKDTSVTFQRQRPGVGESLS